MLTDDKLMEELAVETLMEELVELDALMEPKGNRPMVEP